MTIEGSSQAGYMLDTTEFNAITKGEVDISEYEGQRLFGIHVQLDELKNTPNEELRDRLQQTFEQVAAERLPTASPRGVPALGAHALSESILTHPCAQSPKERKSHDHERYLSCRL